MSGTICALTVRSPVQSEQKLNSDLLIGKTFSMQRGENNSKQAQMSNSTFRGPNVKTTQNFKRSQASELTKLTFKPLATSYNS